MYKVAISNINLNPGLNNNIKFKNYAIGEDGIIDFPIDQNSSGGSSAYDIGGKKTIKVKSKSISSIIKEFNIYHPHLLDLDIKGKEFEVINDSSLSKFNIVRIEYSTIINGKKIGDRKEIVDKLKKYGFKKFRIFKHNEGIYDLNDHGTIEAIK